MSVSISASGNAGGPAGNSVAGINATVDPGSGNSPPTSNLNIKDGPSVPSNLSAVAWTAAFEPAAGITSLAQGAVSSANGYIAKLGELAASLVPPTINPVFPQNVNAPAISAPIAPSVEPIIYTPPAIPAPFVQAISVDTSYPQFDNAPPTLTFPAAPTFIPGTLPAAPGVDLNFVYPEVSVDLPAPPPLLSLDVQRFDGVTFPTLSAVAPVLTIAQPRTYNYVEGLPYTDALLSTLQAELKKRLDTGLTGVNTGLPSTVETNIWNASREKEWRAKQDAIAAIDRMEGMGYQLPSGAYVDARIKIETEAQATFAGSARDIATAQAKLEQDNISKALDATQQLEGKLIDYANQRAQRAFEATRYATEAGISIYNAEVQAYSAQVNAYRAAIDVYTAQINGARAQVEIYTAEIAAEKLKVDMNVALIQEYKVRVDAALASLEVFKGEIAIIQTQAQIENLKVSIYGEQVRAYTATINVFSAEVEAYKAGIQAEGTKEQAYATSASAYGTLVQATTAQITAKIDVFKAQLAAKTEEYDAYKAQVQGQAEQVRAIAASNSAVADIYRATVSGTSSYNDAMVKEWQAQIQLAESVTQIGVQAAQANGQLYLTARSVLTDAAKVGAQVEAQIAASALGAVTYATHQSHQDSTSLGFSSSFGNSKSESMSTSLSYGNSVSNSTSASVSASVQTSASSSNGVQKTIQSVE